MPKSRNPNVRPPVAKSLAATLKKWGFKRWEKSEPNEWVYLHRKDDNLTVVVDGGPWHAQPKEKSDRVIMVRCELGGYGCNYPVPYLEMEADSGRTLKEVNEYIAERIAARAENLEKFKVLLAEVRQRCAQAGVVGSFKKPEHPAFECQVSKDFWSLAYKNDPMFGLSYGHGCSHTLTIGAEEYDVFTADQIMEYLCGKTFDYWPTELDRIHIEKNKIYTFNNRDQFFPLFFTHGLKSIEQREDIVDMIAPLNKPLDALVRKKSLEMTYTIITLKRPVTEEEVRGPEAENLLKDFFANSPSARAQKSPYATLHKK